MSGHRVEAAAAAVAKAGKDGGRTSVAAVEFDVVTDFLVQLASAVCLPLALCSPLGLLALQSSASHFTSKFFGIRDRTLPKCIRRHLGTNWSSKNRITEFKEIF